MLKITMAPHHLTVTSDELIIWNNVGDLLVKQWIDPERGSVVEIEKADPVIVATGEFLHDLERLSRSGTLHPSVTITDDYLKIEASNRTVIYRITDYDPQRDLHRLEWPD